MEVWALRGARVDRLCLLLSVRVNLLEAAQPSQVALARHSAPPNVRPRWRLVPRASAHLLLINQMPAPLGSAALGYKHSNRKKKG